MGPSKVIWFHHIKGMMRLVIFIKGQSNDMCYKGENRHCRYYHDFIFNTTDIIRNKYDVWSDGWCCYCLFISLLICFITHGPLAKYVQLQVSHAPGMPGTFSPPPRVSDPDMHHGTCVAHVPWCMPGSLTSGLHRSRWRGKRSRHSRCMHNP